MAQHEPWSAERARAVVAPHRDRPGALLPIFHALQDTFGYISEDAIRLVADEMNLTRAEVYGVVSFYHDFRHAPAGRHSLKLCRAESCQAMGSDALAERVQQRLGIKFGETTPDGRVSLDAVYCLGLCALSPSAMPDLSLRLPISEHVRERLIEQLELDV